MKIPTTNSEKCCQAIDQSVREILPGQFSGETRALRLPSGCL